MQLWRSRNTKRPFYFIWMSQHSFKLLINWAVIMMCQWGWRGRNNLQVGEMRHEWLPSLTCAMLLVCVRSRQIPSVLSPFASVMGGSEHQFFPLPAYSSSSSSPCSVSWKYKLSTWLHLSEGAGLEAGTSVSTPKFHLLNRTQPESTPLHGRKELGNETSVCS